MKTKAELLELYTSRVNDLIFAQQRLKRYQANDDIPVSIDGHIECKMNVAVLIENIQLQINLFYDLINRLDSFFNN
jgi:hypothetical protein